MIDQDKHRLRLAMAEVMGLEHPDYYYRCQLVDGSYTWLAGWMLDSGNPSWSRARVVAKLSERIFGYWDDGVEVLLAYESDIAAVWQVVKHLEVQGYSWRISKDADWPLVTARFTKEHEPDENGLVTFSSGFGKNESESVAICLAAYMAVKGEVWK